MKYLLLYMILIFSMAASAQPVIDSLAVQQATNPAKIQTASAAGTNDAKQPRKIDIVKKDVDYSIFVKLAIGMMCFIALFYTTAQTWNPG
jgi:hypothetical protein